MAHAAGLLVTDGIVVTGGSPGAVFTDGAVFIRDGRVAAVGAAADVQAAVAAAGVAPVILSAQGRVVLPGLINAHMHCYSTFACGLLAEPAPNFTRILETLWWRLDRALEPEAIGPSALIVLLEGLRSGVTTVIDHHASPAAIPGSLAAIAAAARTAGVRVNLCYEVTDRGGRAEAAAGIAENVRHLEACARAADGFVTGSFGLHASFTVGDATLRESVAAARALGAGFHVHVAEDRADQAAALRDHGRSVVARFHAAGVLGPRTVAVHGVHVDAAERALLRATDTILVTNLQSNMNNAVGLSDTLGMLEDGILVGIGSDGMTANILDEARVFPLIQRHAAGDPRVGFGEAATLLLDHNPRIASRLFDDTLGTLVPGARGDLVITDYVPFTDVATANLAGHLLFGVARSRMRTTIVGGEVRYHEGEFPGLDEAAIRVAAREVAARVWRRF